VPVTTPFEDRSTEAPVDEGLERREMDEAVRRGFQSLPARDQNLLRLLLADPPLPYRDIERLLDMPHGSIGPTRRRCLDKLGNTPAVAALFGGSDRKGWQG
jgi:hypothetical protein